MSGVDELDLWQHCMPAIGVIHYRRNFHCISPSDWHLFFNKRLLRLLSNITVSDIGRVEPPTYSTTG